jgi:hypothetical protein
MPAKYTDAQRIAAFWSRVDKSGECWLWQGAQSGTGYGTINVRRGGKNICLKAHRVSWEWANGPVPPGAWVLHECDTKLCVRPAHLHLGDRAANAAEAAERGRIASGAAHWSKRLPESRARGTHNGQAKLSTGQVLEARRRYADGGITLRKLALEHGVSKETMRDAIRGKNWAHL